MAVTASLLAGTASRRRKVQKKKEKRRENERLLPQTVTGRNVLARRAVKSGEIDRPGQFLGAGFNPIERAPRRRTILGR